MKKLENSKVIASSITKHITEKVPIRALV